ncbi:MAG: hypothetical protein HOO91_17015 [Bacteroidales bacterium]|nr:hypothetical protein [Bacteroidales bacterium]
MIIILIITLVALSVFSIWNILSLRELKSKKTSENKELNDSKYFELKYKMEFLVAIFSVIVALAGILGYNSLENAKREIKTELNKELLPVESRIKNTERNIRDKDSIVSTLEVKTVSISNNLSSFDSEVKKNNTNLNSLKNKIDIINSKNIIKQNFYIVNSIKFRFNENDTTMKKFYFADLKTNLGDKLPAFDTSPLVIPVSESNAMVKIWKITNETFEVGCNEFYGNIIDTIKFSIVIIKK